MGLGALLAVVVAVSSVISWVAISLITRSPLGAGDSIKLVEFGLLTWVLLVGFAALGVLGGLYVKKETSALLAPFVAWAVITFVLPQLGTAARPVSLLNPVAAVPQTSGVFHAVSYVTGPLSVTEHFKTASSAILEGSAGAFPWGSFAVVGVFATLLFSAVVVTQPSRMRGGASE
jgi:ABC-2 type transport system permease protein